MDTKYRNNMYEKLQWAAHGGGFWGAYGALPIPTQQMGTNEANWAIL